MTEKRTKKGWMAFNFPEENDPPPRIVAKKEPARNKKIALTKQCLLENVKFFEKLEPKTVEDLAVHSKKIAEVKIWLENNVTQPISKDRNVPMLLITGPTGSGKTTTLKVLCRNMQIDIQEWVNPIDKDFELYRGPGQSSRFLEFLTDAKFPSLMVQVPNSKKISLIEDFPNMLHNNPQEFDTVLEACVANGKSAIVFVCTEVVTNNINLARNLFTEEIRLKYKMDNISFNACSATLLKTAMKRAQSVVLGYSDSLKLPVQATIDAIIVSTMGDIRCAMNQYYFASLKGTSELPTEFAQNNKLKVGQKRKRTEKSSSIKTMAKDETLGLFHSLGRVLNPKRREHNGSWRINCDLSALVDEFSVQPGTFNAFLFENYLKYFGDIEDASRAADVLSGSQMLMEKWVEHRETLIVGLWVSAMGLMVFNEHRVSKWNQITGPKKFDKVIDKSKDTKQLHVSDHYYYNLITKNERFHKFNYFK